MFDIGSSELVVIAAVALIVIGPKELPTVLRTVGQWTGKARRMASQFQSQFQEALREAELTDLKKSFDDVKDVATTLRGGNLMSSLANVVGPLDIDKPAASPQPITPAQPVAPVLSIATTEPAAAPAAVQANPAPGTPDVVPAEAPPSTEATVPKPGEPLALVGDTVAPLPPPPVSPT